MPQLSSRRGEIKQMKVQISQGEPKPYDAWFQGVGFEVIREGNVQPSGDFRSENIIIERKTAGDFDSSITSPVDHIWDQLQRMAEYMLEWPDAYCYLIVIGSSDYENMFSDFTDVHRVGAIGSMLVRYYGIPVTFVANEYHAFLLMRKIFTSHAQGKAGIGRELRTFKSSDKTSVLENVFSIVQGVSRKRAKDIVSVLEPKELNDDQKQYFTEMLANIDGIGPVTAQRVVDTLGILLLGFENSV